MSDTPSEPEQQLDVEEGSPDPTAEAGNDGVPVPRVADGTEAAATIVLMRLEIFFQVYPGTTTRDGTAIGIADVPYVLRFANGSSTNGQTDADGRVVVSIPAGTTAELTIFNTDYEISARDTLEPVTRLAGVQRRLQMVGFDLGEHGVDGDMGQFTERAVLDLQYDADLDIDARIDRETRNALSSADWAGE